MPIPSSGALTLSTIQTEFGGTNPIGLDEYYAGGANVPSGTTGTNGAVPSSGAISISAFYGTSKFSISGGDPFVSGIGFISGAGTQAVTTSSASSGTITGGSSPYTFLWQYVSGDAFTPNTSTLSSTTFSTTITVGGAGEVTKTGVYRCRVTDNTSAVIFGPDCTVEATLTEIS